MTRALGRKQRTDNNAWLLAAEHIEEYVTRGEIDALEESTLTEIKSNIGAKNAAYAWSGGKDSIVLGALCEKAGIGNSMIGICNLEYPAFMEWVDAHKPQGCEVINTGQDLAWLATHPDMLFPASSAIAAKWFSIVQHTAQRRYFKAHGVEVLILGRRLADGNYVGRGANIYTDGAGVTRYSPLAAWTHEHILAYVHYHKLSLPPFYGWKNGYLCGTHPWPARQWTGGNGWQEVYDIDPSIVISAASVIPGAKAFLEGGAL